VTRGLTTITYLALFLFGAAQGMLGAFYYNSGPPPLASLGFDLAILATCLLAAWGTERPAAAFLPALGWFIAAFVLASGTKGGSVIVTASSGGEWFLFGGAAGAMIGALAGFTVSSRRKPAGSRD
jgi:hypothetical protein